MPLQKQLSGCRYVTPKRCQITSSPTFCRITYNPTNYDHFKIISHNFGGFQIASHNHGFYMLQHGNMLPSFEQMFHLSEAKQRKDKGTKRKSHWTFDDAPGRQCDDAPLDFAKVWFCVEFGCVLKRENITCRYIVQYIVNKQIYIYNITLTPKWTPKITRAGCAGCAWKVEQLAFFLLDHNVKL